jgi:hypothetical protein
MSSEFDGSERERGIGVGSAAGALTPRCHGAPPRRRVLMERASDRVPAARSHTPNHYVGVRDRAAATKEELEMEAAGRRKLVKVHFQRTG